MNPYRCNTCNDDNPSYTMDFRCEVCLDRVLMKEKSMEDTDRKILLSHYVDMTQCLVKNQARLVDGSGYCISWKGDKMFYPNIEAFVEEVRNQLSSEFSNSLTYDISVDEAMERYDLV